MKNKDIYDLGFEEITIPMSLEDRRQFFWHSSQAVEHTKKCLQKGRETFKIIVAQTSDPGLLVDISNLGIKIIKVNYCPDNLETPRFSPFFLHYLIFYDEEEYNFYRLMRGKTY